MITSMNWFLGKSALVVATEFYNSAGISFELKAFSFSFSLNPLLFSATLRYPLHFPSFHIYKSLKILPPPVSCDLSLRRCPSSTQSFFVSCPLFEIILL